MSALLSIVSMLSVASLAVNAHIWMEVPVPRGGKANTQYPIDYDLMAPMGTDKPFPCGGKKAGPITTQWKAGTTVQIQLAGTAGMSICI